MKSNCPFIHRFWQFLKVAGYVRTIKELPAILKWLVGVQPVLVFVSPITFFGFEVALLLLTTIFWLRKQRRIAAGKAVDYFAPLTFVCSSTTLLGLIQLSHPGLGADRVLWISVTAGASYVWFAIVLPTYGPGFFGLENE